MSHGPGVRGRPAALPVRRGPAFAASGPSHAPVQAQPFFAGPLVAATASQPGLGSNGVTPSDSTGAIGLVHYIEIVNTQVGLYDRALTHLATVDLSTFIGGTAEGDVQVQYDPQAKRWEYVSLESISGNDGVGFGWSKADDVSALTLANSDWCNFHLSTGTNLFDYPKLGHDANFILIGANIFANNANFTSAVILAIAKPVSTDTSCTAPTVSQFGTAGTPLRHPSPDLSLAFTPEPSNTADSAATGYVVATDQVNIGVWHVSPISVGACTVPPCLISDGDIPITAWAAGAEFQVPQPGGNPNVDALDGRLTQAVQHADPKAGGASAVWTQHTTGSLSGRTVVTWFELLPGMCTSGACPIGARRQEGTISDPSLYIFNGATSPTSSGDAAVIQYNTGSVNTFVDVRAQSHDAAAPLNSMSGEIVLRRSTVADTDFSCFNPFGPPCRWGDYSGASPDPTDCSLVWGTNMLSGDVASGGAPTWTTQNFAVGEGTVRTAVSTQQYLLNGSDGQTWTDIDAAKLSLAASPCTSATGLVTANADLFTSLAGVNQDIGVFVDVDGVPSTSPLAWKESGGFNGTFSPNAAYVQATFPMPTGHTYAVKLRWKANVSTAGSIFAGAGPLPNNTYSPTRLTLRVLATPPSTAVMSTQQANSGSDGATFVPIPGLTPLTLAPTVDSRAVLGGSADLWTNTAGFNQDMGIQVSGGAFGTGQVVAWKESGGFNGTFSPNAAFVEATVALTGGTSYTAKLVWKTNRPAPGVSIFAGAGPLPGTTSFSPSSLFARLLPAGANPFEGLTTTQESLTGSNGTTFVQVGVQVIVTPGISTYSVIGANADLFTATAGFNQDLAVFVTDNGSAPQLLVWKESGGFGGTFSPNAAFAETVYPMIQGHTYIFSLMWKTNRSAPGATIFAGAGPILGAFSPTRIDVELVN